METSTSPIVQTSSLTLPTSCKQYITEKIDNLVEISHIPETAQIQNSLVPILNPYSVFRRNQSFSRQLRHIISRPSIAVKEYVQSSALSQCILSSVTTEQYVTLEIPPHFIQQWRQQKYTHLHFGAIRLVFSYHGRQGLPITARLSLLDTRYLNYEHAVIGSIATTLNAGSVVLTFFPNFNRSLEDSHFSQALKVQVQITGADQVADTISATLHHQMVYRLQDHAINLQTPGLSSGDAVFIFADSGLTPTIVQTPRQLPREELEKLIPSVWITNYEKLHQSSQLVQKQDPIFIKQLDKTVKVSYLSSTALSSSTPHTISMIQPVKRYYEKKIPIHSFSSNGWEVYESKINGHFIWDVDPSMCDAGCLCQDDLDDQEIISKGTKTWKRKHACTSSHRHDDKDDDQPDSVQISVQTRKDRPWIGLPPEKNKPMSNDDYLRRCFEILKEEGLMSCPPPSVVYSCSFEPVKIPKPVAVPCFMVNPEEFPPLERKENEQSKAPTRPFIMKDTIQPAGSLAPLSAAEEVLNWQTNNAVAQNRYLKKIDNRLSEVYERTSSIETHVTSFRQEASQMHTKLSFRLSKLEQEMEQILATQPTSPLFLQKDREILRLKEQISEIERDLYPN
ncbi:uncharacterized protein LOC125370129 [Ricinus communis]|uniref:uncharacterized protein LOC125370129 n=1 Tax=Ricinus communis TaxID=3988 RepID=UPI00201B0F3B|nr:uncharacterized protein LOC125370129 [Ricinus communis]